MIYQNLKPPIQIQRAKPGRAGALMLHAVKDYRSFDGVKGPTYSMPRVVQRPARPDETPARASAKAGARPTAVDYQVRGPPSSGGGLIPRNRTTKRGDGGGVCRSFALSQRVHNHRPCHRRGWPSQQGR
jgi:hypothetical protein